ncbi:DNA primase [Adhaeribacter pallidiroseus]|uniref:DNA primase n=1 Tax=Adhaeribacter pallidiroseus TaxID=2072847 RepID=A0A369QNH0_9BACT|nr:DNA primase [Adhaeribacter pallidiroseus]RDC63768.1 DNA primase [Adhaeribacter pallidiroseus]
MALIKKETVDQILAQADIVEVVGDFVSLKKKGQNMWAPCPFHNEKSPSFSVSPAKGIYKCFGCGKAGNSVQFIMDVEGTSYVEALKYLAKKYGIEIAEEATPEATKAQNERDSQFILSDFAKNYYQEILFNHDQGKTIGLPYLQERGLSLPIIKKFELGYSLEAWDGFTSKALAQGYQQRFLESTGLTIVKEDKKYDRFRARVMFPIHNVSGRVIGFGARTLKSNDKTPKYLNSPESEIYHKSDVLYGLFQAKNAIRAQDVCYLVEGYLDVLSLSQGGLENVVASSGTSLTEGQIKLIGRYTKNITVLYDGDAAGIKASLRGIDLILEGGLNVNVVTFPQGDDPDSYIRKVGDVAFKEYVDSQSQDFISFKTNLYARDAKDNPVKKAEAIREIVSSIAKIPDSIKRQIFLKQCSSIFKIDEDVLIAEFNKIFQQNRQQQQKQNTTATSNREFTDEELAEAEAYAVEAEASSEPDPELDILYHHEKEVIRLALTYPTHPLSEAEVFMLPYLLEQLDDTTFHTPVFQEIIDFCRQKLAEGHYPVSDDFINHPRSEIRTAAINLMSQKYELSDNWQTHQIFVPRETDQLQYAADTALLRLKRCNVQQMIKENMEQLKSLTDFAAIKNQMEILKTLKTYEDQFSEQLGTVVAR